MTQLEYLKWLIDALTPWAFYSERVDDALTELYILYAEALAEAAPVEEVA